MSKPDVLILGAYPEWDMAPLAADYALHTPWLAPDRETLLSEVAPKARAIATKGELGASRALIDRCPKLEIIACYGVGVDAIDLARARERGIRVTSTPDVLTDDVADLALAMILGLLRNIIGGDSHVRSGAWAAGPLPLGRSMRGRSIGILGLGRIGKAVADRAAAFGAIVAYHSRRPADGVAFAHHDTAVSLARGCDILVVTAPGGEATRNLVNAEVLEALGPEGLLVNVARGSVVDEAALIDALEAKRIAGAALDVFCNEPCIDPRFLGLDNVLLQPHQGSGTVETRKAMGKLVRDNLAAHFAGRPLLTPIW